MKYLGIDWGLKKVGLAISEGEEASPRQTITINGLIDGVAKIKKIIDSEGIQLVVMGLPEGEMGKNVQRAVKAFQKEGLEIILTDETLSTYEAKKVLLEMQIGRQARREDNAVAAAIILQNYLDERKR